MDSLNNAILAEISALRELKRCVFKSELYKHTIHSSEICLTADILLLPLYWYCLNNKDEIISNIPLEDYMKDALVTFEDNEVEIIPYILRRSQYVNQTFPNKPLQTYRNLLLKCFPNYRTDSGKIQS